MNAYLVSSPGGLHTRLTRLAAILVAIIVAFAVVLASPTDAGSPKKGIGLGRCYTAQQSADLLKGLDAAWYYDWGFEPKLAPNASVQFVPMLWGTGRNFKRGLEAVRGAKVLLGFNEPDLVKQSSIPVDEALAVWPDLSGAVERIGSPAPAHALAPWMREFMRKVDADQLKVDFVAVHWYSGPKAERFLRFLERVHETYHRPIWITEFAVAQRKQHPQGIDPALVQSFMRQVIPALDALPYVERYAWFGLSCKSKPHLAGSRLFDESGKLTDLGRLYAGY